PRPRSDRRRPHCDGEHAVQTRLCPRGRRRIFPAARARPGAAGRGVLGELVVAGMSERIGPGFRAMLAGVALIGALTIAASLALIVRGAWFEGLVLGGVAILLLRWFWRLTARKRALSRHGFHSGMRV